MTTGNLQGARGAFFVHVLAHENGVSASVCGQMRAPTSAIKATEPSDKHPLCPKCQLVPRQSAPFHVKPLTGPTQLIGRDTEHATLRQRLLNDLEAAAGSSSIVTGPIGCGKTSLVRDVVQSLGRHAKPLYVNCRLARSATHVLAEAMQQLDQGYPMRGFAPREILADMRRIMTTRGHHGILVLDEAGTLPESDLADLCYLLSRFQEAGGTVAPLSTIYVSEQDFRLCLPAAAASTLGSWRLHLLPISKEATRRLVAERAHQALGPCADEIVDAIARDACTTGDLRRALHWLRSLGERAQSLQVAPHAGLLASTRPPGRAASDLSGRQAILFEACAQKCRSGSSTTGEVERLFQDLCRERGIEPTGHTQLWKYLKDLRRRGFIDARLSGAGQAGTTQIITVRPEALA